MHAHGLLIRALRPPGSPRYTRKKKVVELSVECQIHPRVPDVEILEPPSRVCGEGVPKCRRSCFEQGVPLARRSWSFFPASGRFRGWPTSSTSHRPTSPARFAPYETFVAGVLESETHLPGHCGTLLREKKSFFCRSITLSLTSWHPRQIMTITQSLHGKKP